MGGAAKKTELTPGTLDMLIIKTMKRGAGPTHGYGIAHYIEQISNNALEAILCVVQPA